MHVPQTPELRGKSNRTHTKAEKVFHTQDPTINWRSHVQVPASVPALAGPGHKTGPNNYLSLPGAHPRPPPRVSRTVHTTQIAACLWDSPPGASTAPLSPSHLHSQRPVPAVAPKLLNARGIEQALRPSSPGQAPTSPLLCPSTARKGSCQRSRRA